MSKVWGPDLAPKARELSTFSEAGGMLPPENFGLSYMLECDFLHFKGSLNTKYYDEKQHNFSQPSTFFDNI